MFKNILLRFIRQRVSVINIFKFLNKDTFVVRGKQAHLKLIFNLVMSNDIEIMSMKLLQPSIKVYLLYSCESCCMFYF